MSYRTIGANSFDGELFKFEEPGDTFEGVLVGLRQVTTDFGPGIVADFECENDAKFSIFLNAGLKFRVTEKLLNKQLKITYTGEARNPKTKRTYKAFDVLEWVDSDDSEIPF
jgi:hypothetical protein